MVSRVRLGDSFCSDNRSSIQVADKYSRDTGSMFACARRNTGKDFPASETLGYPFAASNELASMSSIINGSDVR